MTLIRTKNSFLIVLLMMCCSLTACLSKRKAPAPILRHHKGSDRNHIPNDIADGTEIGGCSGNLMENYAQLMGVNVHALENENLYRFIDDWLGTPYAYGGETKSGIDCSGFASTLMSQVYGKTLPRSSDEQAAMVKRKYEQQLVEGDLVFFSFGHRGIDHVGIYLQNGKFVHASTSKGVIISNLRDVWYYKAFKRCGTVK